MHGVFFFPWFSVPRKGSVSYRTATAGSTGLEIGKCNDGDDKRRGRVLAGSGAYLLYGDDDIGFPYVCD